MHRFFLSILFLVACIALSSLCNLQVVLAQEQPPSLETESFEFVVNGNKLVGLLDKPVNQEPISTIIIVHGYGKTNVVAQNWHYSMRSLFAEAGLNVVIWDKPGCGQSEGVFDINQPVESSAKEVVAAVQALKQSNIKGTGHIGLWGISRAGWIAPLAMQEEEEISFWISVSGTDDKENARYLIESNLRIEGRTDEEVQMLVSEWQTNFNTGWKNGTYEEYLNATPNLYNDEFMQLMGWTGGYVSEAEFLAYQNKFKTGELVVDEKEELLIYVPGFKDLLGSIDRPVLALFGEKDTNVDWRKTFELYKETIGNNPKASLTLRSFANANHNMKDSETGGIREMMNQDGNTPFAEGYFETMKDWLIENNFGRSN